MLLDLYHFGIFLMNIEFLFFFFFNSKNLKILKFLELNLEVGRKKKKKNPK
jgi:hypothetical protein